MESVISLSRKPFIRPLFWATLRATFVLVLFVMAASAGMPLAQSAPDAAGALQLNTVEDLRALERRVQEVVARVRPAVVGLQVGGAAGSGVIFTKDGWVATAGHVVAKPGVNVQVTLADGTTMPGKTFGLHVPMDYGLVKIHNKGKELPFVELGDSDRVVPGQWMLPMGHPGGAEPGRGPVVRTGRVLLPKNPSGMITLDAPLIFGDSGGPLFDLSGKVVGINQSIALEDDDTNNCTPINGFRKLLPQLRANKVLGAGPGVDFGAGGGIEIPLTRQEQGAYQRAMKMLLEKRFEESITAFQPLIDKEFADILSLYNAACAYSLRSKELSDKGDAAAADEHAKKAVELLRRSVAAGWADLDHTREDKDLDPLRARADYQAFEREFRKTIYKPVLGVNVTQATGGGVAVTDVTDGAAAHAAGIRVGDVIIGVGERTIHDAADFANALSAADFASATEFKVRRDGREMDIRFLIGPQDPSLRQDEYKNGGRLLGLWRDVTAHFKDQVFVINQRQNRHIGLAVAVARNGYLITKASQVKRGPVDIELAPDRVVQARVVAKDRRLDLALLKADTTFERAVDFTAAADFPELASFIVSIGSDGQPLSQGVVALPPYNSDNLGAPDPKGPFVGIRAEDFEDAELGVSGVKLAEVTSGSPAEIAGMLVGDVLVSINGAKIEGWLWLIQKIREHKVGETVRFGGLRDGETVEYQVLLVSRDSILTPTGDAKPVKPWIGMRLKVMEEGGHGGLVVTRVDEGGPAQEAGMAEGDIIRYMNNKVVASIKDVGDLLAALKPGQSVALRGLRRDKAFSATLKIGSKTEDGDAKASLGLTAKPHPDGSGLLVTRIEDNGPADRAGIWEDDVLLFADKAALRDALAAKKPGQAMTFSLRRGDELIEVTLTLDVWRERLPRDAEESGLEEEVSIRAQNFGEVIHHDGRIGPSDAGSLLVDLNGRVVGLNIARSSRVRSFALPSARVAEAVKALLAEAKKD